MEDADLPGSPAAGETPQAAEAVWVILVELISCRKLRAMSARACLPYTQITDAVRRTQGKRIARGRSSVIPFFESSIHFFIQKIFTQGKGCGQSESLTAGSEERTAPWIGWSGKTL